jgi:HEAT repeat protein
MLGLSSCANAADEPNEPTQDGRTVSQWIRMLKSKDVSERRHAAAALGIIGTPTEVVIPALGEALKDEDWEVRRNATH